MRLDRQKTQADTRAPLHHALAQLGKLIGDAARWARKQALVLSTLAHGKPVIRIEDDGAGIPSDLRECVFKPVKGWTSLRPDQAWVLPSQAMWRAVEDAFGAIPGRIAHPGKIRSRIFNLKGGTFNARQYGERA